MINCGRGEKKRGYILSKQARSSLILQRIPFGNQGKCRLLKRLLHIIVVEVTVAAAAKKRN